MIHLWLALYIKFVYAKKIELREYCQQDVEYNEKYEDGFIKV